ncbi:hypothetical protein Poly51_51810 [Rubripirellula tenax]|uniref:Rho termination factor-like N-terminal domain-containing protein n=1 Tax=Rubripirellula tenax TaxID=2528015 RepID=A0A5C6EIA4_9BACT|nr:DUF4912 domain-containing protein [Rubripirellula tenax]TWU47381.1 hypothetical protein Poly51_51810 [Rubripirellula tenax]
MITTADLKAQTRRELADLARNYNVPGWHGMKKDELVEEIRKVQRRLRRKSTSSNSTSESKLASAKATTRKTPQKVSAKAKKASSPVASKTATSKPLDAKSATSKSATLKASASKRNAVASDAGKVETVAKQAARTTKSTSYKSDQQRLNKPVPKLPEPRIDPKTARIRAQMRKRRETMMKNKDLSTGMLVAGAAVNHGAQRTRGDEPHQDRVVLMVRDSFWLQATWEITRASVQRAQSSLAERWHTAMPVLRLLAVSEVDSNGAERTERDIPIHGGVNNWYIDVDEPPSRFRVAVGYVTSTGEFHTLCRSNVVETPQPNDCERLDEHWHDIAEDYERIYSLSGGYDTDAGDLKEVFEERLRRPMPIRGDKGQTVGDPSLLRQSQLPFEVDAELIIFGKTLPSASVLVSGRPVKLQPDGSFTVRMQLPDKRQVLPVTAESRDGLRQRTTVVAVERNTKVMEPVELEDRF